MYIYLYHVCICACIYTSMYVCIMYVYQLHFYIFIQQNTYKINYIKSILKLLF